MHKILTFAMLLAFLTGPVIALAQVREENSGLALKSACRADYRAHCSGADPAPAIAAACLAQFYVNLTKNCQAALDAYNAPPGEAPDQ